ncbi:MAG: solute carrier family 26 protein [Bacteroidota bacterium]
MKRIFPILEWLPAYRRADLSGDIAAGLTVGVMLIPQGMAYAMLGGLPPIYGLYTATLPLIIYAIMGSSRHLAVGPMAIVAILLIGGVSTLAEPFSEAYVGLATTLTLMVGVLMTLMGLLRLGFLANLLSRPVILGYTTAAAVIIMSSQLKYILGVDVPRGSLLQTWQGLWAAWSQTHLWTLAIGAPAIVGLYLLKKSKSKIPGPLLAVVVGILVVWLGNLEAAGVAIVGQVPAGLPTVKLPVWDLDILQELAPTAVAIALVGFTGSIAVATALQNRAGINTLRPNQELWAFGLSNLVGGLFQAFPAMGGLGRSAVNYQSGAKTGLASLISSGLLILTLLFFTRFFYFLPKAILAAIIIVAVSSLINITAARRLWYTDRRDFAIFLLTVGVTLFVGIEAGVMTGIALSLGRVLLDLSRPHVAEMGQVPGTTRYRNVERFEDIESDPDLLIMRFDAPLFFANLAYFREKIQTYIQTRPGIQHIILDAKAIDWVDASAVEMLKELVRDYESRQIKLYMVSVKGPVRDVLLKSGIVESLGEHRFFFNVNDAVRTIRGNSPETPRKYVMQKKQD